MVTVMEVESLIEKYEDHYPLVNVLKEYRRSLINTKTLITTVTFNMSELIALQLPLDKALRMKGVHHKIANELLAQNDVIKIETSSDKDTIFVAYKLTVVK